jgi:hypothetical protein
MTTITIVIQRSAKPRRRNAKRKSFSLWLFDFWCSQSRG